MSLLINHYLRLYKKELGVSAAENGGCLPGFEMVELENGDCACLPIAPPDNGDCAPGLTQLVLESGECICFGEPTVIDPPLCENKTVELVYIEDGGNLFLLDVVDENDESAVSYVITVTEVGTNQTVTWNSNNLQDGQDGFSIFIGTGRLLFDVVAVFEIDGEVCKVEQTIDVIGTTEPECCKQVSVAGGFEIVDIPYTVKTGGQICVDGESYNFRDGAEIIIGGVVVASTPYVGNTSGQSNPNIASNYDCVANPGDCVVGFWQGSGIYDSVTNPGSVGAVPPDYTISTNGNTDGNFRLCYDIPADPDNDEIDVIVRMKGGSSGTVWNINVTCPGSDCSNTNTDCDMTASITDQPLYDVIGDNNPPSGIECIYTGAAHTELKEAIANLANGPQTVTIPYSFIPQGVYANLGSVNEPAAQVTEDFNTLNGLTKTEFIAEVDASFAQWKILIESIFPGLTVNFVNLGDEGANTHPFIDGPQTVGGQNYNSNYALPYIVSGVNQNVGQIRFALFPFSDSNNLSVLAYAFAPELTPGTGAINADILINKNFTFRKDNDSAAAGYSMQWLIMHELGHTFGLGHAEPDFCQGDILCGSVSPSDSFEDFGMSEWSQECVEQLYEPGNSTTNFSSVGIVLTKILARP